MQKQSAVARAAGTILLAAWQCACGGGGATGPAPTPAETVAVSGRIVDTFTGQAIPGPAWIRFGTVEFDATDGRYAGTLAPGQYTVTVDGQGFLYKRIRGRVVVGGGTLDFDAVGTAGSDAFDASHYQAVAMGVGSSNGVNWGGKSVRWPGPISRIVVVADGAEVAEETLQAIREASSVIGELTGGVLATPPLEVVGELPSPQRGEIAVRLDGCGGVRTSVQVAAKEIWSAVIHACPGLPVGAPGSLKHEFAHALGFDRSTRPDSLMNPERSDLPGPSPVDVRTGTLKYKRLPGHVLDLVQDLDGAGTWW